MYTLYQFRRRWGLPNASPFCLKLEAYLRMAKLDYNVHFLLNPSKSPKGKLPCLRIEEELLTDSELIIDRLEINRDNSAIAALSEEDNAIAVAVDNSLSERLYWIMVYLRWKEDAGFNYIKADFFKGLAIPFRWFVPFLVRRNLKKALYFQGIGRHNQLEVIALGKKVVDSVSVILAEKNWLLSDELPSWVDASVFGFMANLLLSPMDDPLKKYALEKNNLLPYVKRFWQKYFKDLPFVTGA